ncbi:MAG TPA: T9SS type A sorting domain-containing protein [Rhodothermales bacterium]|nr:T9SS type A sorting domain-containing protein [Rhodothermales bacterium]
MKILSNLLMIGLLLMALLPASATGQVAARLAEVGTNDFRITPVVDGRATSNALNPAVAYNSDLGEFLTVWSGDEDVDGAFEIYGQRLKATGERLGKVFRISDMGATDAPVFDALAPAVVYNDRAAEYLVVWSGDDVDGAFAVYGQRLKATGEEAGSNDFLIARAPALRPALAFNPDQQEYLIVWQGEEGPRAAEIFGQRLAATGNAVGTPGFRISDMGEVDKGAAFDASRPAVTYNAKAEEYLVVWEGDDDSGFNVDNAFEIFGQRLKATGEEVGTNDFPVSDMGSEASAIDFGAHRPSIAYNRAADEYLVAWLGDDDASGLLDNEYEIFAQRLQGDSGKAIGANDFRVSDMGEARNPRFAAAYPAVAAAEDGFLVVWRGDHNAGALVDGEHEIFARRITGDANAAGGFRISDMGAEDGDSRFAAAHPAVVASDNSFLVIWSGNDDDVAFSNGAGIFGQQVQARADGPARLAAFSAVVDSAQAVQLKWNVVGSPVGTSFDVEHRTTGVFEAIGRVDGGAEDAFAFPVEALQPGRHVFRLKQVGPDGSSLYSAEVEALIEVPGDFFSTSAYPNPFNDATTFTLTVKETQHVELAVYDMLGRRVAELHNGLVEANQIRTFRFKADNFSSGTYFLRAVGNTFLTTQQVLLVK